MRKKKVYFVYYRQVICVVGFWKRKPVPPRAWCCARAFPCSNIQRTPCLTAAPVPMSICFVFCQGARVFAGYRPPMHCHLQVGTAKAAPRREESQGNSIIRGHGNNCTGDSSHKTLRILLNAALLRVNANYSQNSKKRNKTIRQRKDSGDLELRSDTVRFSCLKEQTTPWRVEGMRPKLRSLVGRSRLEQQPLSSSWEEHMPQALDYELGLVTYFG